MVDVVVTDVLATVVVVALIVATLVTILLYPAQSEQAVTGPMGLL